MSHKFLFFLEIEDLRALKKSLPESLKFHVAISSRPVQQLSGNFPKNKSLKSLK